MITLITGTPGSGKTLYAVWLLQKELKAGRRLVVDGIKDLAVEHELVDEAWIRDWHNRRQPNDVIVVDEVQRYWPNVSISVKATEDIEKLHVHRHMGVDFIVVTQHPQRMNKAIRDLVGRHVHVRRLFGLKMAMLYEWDHCHNPNAGFKDAVQTRWSYPKSVFKMYTSAEIHTKQKAVVPKALFVLPVALIAGLWFAWKSFQDVVPTAWGGKAGRPVGASAVAVMPARASAEKGAASSIWHVGGRYAVDGRTYVLLVDGKGHFRSVTSEEFHGDSLRVEGIVDGERVTSWSADGDGAGNAIGGHK